MTQNSLILKGVTVTEGSIFRPKQGIFEVTVIFSSLPHQYMRELIKYSYENYYGLRVITFRNSYAISHENFKEDLQPNEIVSIILYKNVIAIDKPTQYRLVHIKRLGRQNFGVIEEEN